MAPVFLLDGQNAVHDGHGCQADCVQVSVIVAAGDDVVRTLEDADR